MENESTFVAPEGVYSVTEEHKPTPLAQHTIAAAPILYPTKVSAVTVRFPTAKAAAASPGLSQLLGGGREREVRKDGGGRPAASASASASAHAHAKEPKDPDGVSVSSSDDPDDGSPDASSTPAPDPSGAAAAAHEQHGSPFSLAPGLGKRKAAPRPKHNMRTTSSTFITRLQNADNLSKALQTKQGEVVFMFYNSAKTFVWTEAGTKLKVSECRRYGWARPPAGRTYTHA